MKKVNVKKVREFLIKHYEKEWWIDALKWLKDNTDFPKLHKLPDHLLDDFHNVFRPHLRSPFIITNEASATNRLTAYSRIDMLKNMRVSLLPHWIGKVCPVFRSRAVGNFGLIVMLTEKDDIFSRAFYNLPFPFHQKVKRTVISCYGLAKHGRSIDEITDFPDGGVFLLKPEKDEKYEKFAKYTDYSYVTLDWRFPETYDEFIKTLDGAVLISRSAAEKLKYRRVGYIILRNPAIEISEKHFGLITKKIPEVGTYINYQQTLTDVEDETARMSSVTGYITKIELLTPLVKDPMRKVWRLTVEEDREAEIGCKLESPQGLKHTIAGYVNDDKPVIVINPESFKDRAIYEEIKQTGKIHCYPTIPGKDGNISSRNIRISRTLVQGIFCYPPDIRNEIIEKIFNKKTLTFPYPSNILWILENMHRIDPDKLMKKYPVFYNHFYYIRQKKVGEKFYLYDEPTKLYRAWKKLNKVKDFNKLSKFDQESVNSFIKQIIQKILLFDQAKKCQIKIRGYIRILEFHSDPEVNVIHLGRSFWEELGEPEYVLVAKEPVTRDTSIRCMKVKVKSDDEVPPWVAYIHPYFAMDHENPTSENFHTKADQDGDLLLIIPLTDPIPGAMYKLQRRKYDRLWKENKGVTLKTVKHFEPYKSLKDFLLDIYEYNRRESIEQLIMQQFGGIKNRAMFTDLILDWKKWKEFVNKWDLELKGFQAEKFNPELKDATPEQLNEFYTRMLKEAQSARLPDYIEEYKQLRKLDEVDYHSIKKVRKVLKLLKKSKHPVIQLMARIYDELEIV